MTRLGVDPSRWERRTCNEVHPECDIYHPEGHPSREEAAWYVGQLVLKALFLLWGHEFRLVTPPL